jgi:hypothetical protein
MNIPFRFPTTDYSQPPSEMTKVAMSDGTSVPASHEPHEQDTASSFSSVISFQTITNWWSPGSTSAGSAIGKPSSDVKKYVSKEKQLEKLRSRLDQERKANCRGRLQVDACRACGTGKVYL